MTDPSQVEGLPPAQPRHATDLETLHRQTIVETFRASGPGGQRKNKVETAVRIKHIPTGITVTAAEQRSQAQNREMAFQRLQARLTELNRPRKKRLRTKTPAGALQRRKEKKRRQAAKKKLRSGSAESE